jgi:phosphonate transport system substrate-binding protein
MNSVKIGIALCFCLISSVARPKDFSFTAIPDENSSRLMERFGKVAEYLTTKLDVPVHYIPVMSYAASVTAFRNDQVQLAWFGGLSGVQARALVPGSEAVAQGFEDQLFVTYFIANSETTLKPSIDFPVDIEGKTFTFGAKGSTSGRLMPEYYIRKYLKKSPETAFPRVGFSGDHDRTIALVQTGAYEVGALNYLVWESELEAGRIDAKRVNVIWKTPPYPDYQWTIRGDVDKNFGEGFKEHVKQALLEMKDPDLLASFPRKSFIPASNVDYEPINEVAKSIGLIEQ